MGRAGTILTPLRFAGVRRLIYISRSLMGDNPAAIEAMVERSNVCNATAGITGMLWSDGTSFVQALEGDGAAVESLFQRIRLDPRHNDVEVVFDRAVMQRLFGHWAMILPDDSPVSTANTVFLIGLAANDRSKASMRMYQTVVASAG